MENLADTKPPHTSDAEVATTLASDNNWESLSPHVRSTALEHVEVYLDDLIGIVQE